MAEGKKKMAAESIVSTSTSPTPFIWITDPDGAGPVKCCFTVSGVVDPPGSYIHVSISEIGGVAFKDKHSCFVWADSAGNWTAFICLLATTTVPAGTVVRVRACLVNPATGADAQCMDRPLTLLGDCAPPITPPLI
jgi:hypothetical protein